MYGNHSLYKRHIVYAAMSFAFFTSDLFITANMFGGSVATFIGFIISPALFAPMYQHSLYRDANWKKFPS